MTNDENVLTNEFTKDCFMALFTKTRKLAAAVAASTSEIKPAMRIDSQHALAQAKDHIKPLLSARDVVKSYRKGKLEVPVLKGVDFAIRPGEFVAIVGQSGSGKSTLLHLLGTLDAPDAGEIHFDGKRIDNIAASGRDVLRNQHFGMIFQFYHLLPELTALENVLTPCMIAEGPLAYWWNRRERTAQATALLEAVGLGHRLHHCPRELSGGEMQRTAIARALIAQPQVLLADEPTGNLDEETGGEILEILRTLNKRDHLTIVMVTHDMNVARQADRIVRLVSGRVEEK